MNIDSFLKNIEKKEQRRKPKMKVESRSVFEIQKNKNKRNEQRSKKSKASSKA